jgi:hypothetical protein
MENGPHRLGDRIFYDFARNILQSKRSHLPILIRESLTES